MHGQKNIKLRTSLDFQTTNLMHNSFILQQYVCYTIILNMFRAARCSSSGGQIVSPQPLVSSHSVNSRTVCRLRADSLHRFPPAYCTAVYRGWRYQRLWWYNLSFWGWVACCSKHVEDRSVTYILLKNKGVVLLWKKSILWCTVRKTSNYLPVYWAASVLSCGSNTTKASERN